jgi:hypothetical protein
MKVKPMGMLYETRIARAAGDSDFRDEFYDGFAGKTKEILMCR